MRKLIKRIIDRFSLFVLECKFRSIETSEAKVCRLMTEDIEDGFTINDKL